MNEKEFVLVSQGIEIYRTKSQEVAVNMVKKENDEYFDYRQRCADNYEKPADNYIDLEIEYPNEKDLQERINKAIEYIDKNKQKTIAAYGDNYDDDFEICLWEEDIDNLLEILDKEMMTY